MSFQTVEFAFNSLESFDIKIKVLSIEKARDEVLKSVLRSETTNQGPVL